MPNKSIYNMSRSTASDLAPLSDHPICELFRISPEQLCSVIEATLRGPRPDAIDDDLWQAVWSLRDELTQRLPVAPHSEVVESPLGDSDEPVFELTEEQVDTYLAEKMTENVSVQTSESPLDPTPETIVDDILIRNPG